MSDAPDAAGPVDAVDAARAAIADAVATLTAEGARDEARAVLVQKRFLGIERAAQLQRAGRVWRLGVLLVDSDARLYATGVITRAVPPGHPGHVSQLAEQRKAERAAAIKAGFRDGETVNFDNPEIVLDAAALAASTGTVMLRDGQVVVRWSPASEATPVEFGAYVRERVELLAHPPVGAN